jgi:hypothetical protein
MRGVIAITGLVAVTLTACDRAQPVALDTPVTQSLAPDQDAPPPSPTPDASPSNAPAAQASPSQLACSREQAAEIVRVQPTWQASNDACVVYWRSFEVRQHPERAFYLECNGLKAYPDPQPRGHPISLVECDRKLRERQARMGVAVNGMTDEQKATYRATWGK